MKNVLCFGDSNTWGFTPGTGVRYAPDQRWTGVMQSALGRDYRVLEDGLNARTTVYEDPWSPWRVGKEALPIALVAQKPLDLLVLMLGTNDLKFTDAFGAAKGAETLIGVAQMVQARKESSPVFPNGLKVLLVSPILIDPAVANDPYGTLRNGAEESRSFARYFRFAAEKKGAAFFDAATVARPSTVDGIHMEPESHRALGLALAEQVRNLLEG
ncbi:MAG: SGNH/GDSL hydrolase family protein [Candidatus Faecivicinus sp.]